MSKKEEKNINDLKVSEYRRKKLLNIIFIVLCLLTIFLEGLALFETISVIWGIIPFIFLNLIKIQKSKDNQKK